jgi:hypothetical protein
VGKHPRSLVRTCQTSRQQAGLTDHPKRPLPAGLEGLIADSLQRFPVTLVDHSVNQCDREATSMLALAHVLVGEPDPTLGSSPRACFAGTCAMLIAPCRWTGDR